MAKIENPSRIQYCSDQCQACDDYAICTYPEFRGEFIQSKNWPTQKRKPGANGYRDAHDGILSDTVEKLEKALADAAIFGDVLAHDLKGPIRNLAVVTQMQESLLADGNIDAALRLAKKMQKEAIAAQKIVEDLRIISKLKVNQLQFETVDIAALLHELFETYQDELERNEMSVAVKDLPVIWSNRTALWQIFDNLLRNALIHGGQKSRITIRARQTADLVHFVVCNAQSRCDEPLDNAKPVSPRKSGTGLGLLICERIIQSFGGEMLTRMSSQQFSVEFTLEQKNAGK